MMFIDFLDECEKEDECTLHMSEEVVVQDCTPTENITPHSLYALIVDRPATNKTAPSWPT